MRLIFFALLALLWGCAPKVLNTTSIKVRDSVVYSVKTVYDTIQIETRQADLEFNSVADSTFEERVGRADLKVQVKNGVAHAACRCDSLLIAKKLAIHDTIHHLIRETAKVKTEVKFITSKFDAFCRWFFIACCVAVALYTGIKIAR